MAQNLNKDWADNQEQNATGGNSTFNKLKSTVSSKLHEAAGTVGDKLSNNTSTSKYGDQAASWLNQSADYIESLEPQQLKGDIQEQIRRNPGRSLLIAAAFGLVVGSLFRRG